MATHESNLAYPSWIEMRRRCRARHRKEWGRYGGRGITVCARWDSFEAFLEDMGPRPSRRHHIERVNNERGYEPGNCRWATVKEQARNRKSSRLVRHNGITKTVTEWAEGAGLSPETLAYRLFKLRWPMQEALARPVGRWAHG